MWHLASISHTQDEKEVGERNEDDRNIDANTVSYRIHL